MVRLSIRCLAHTHWTQFKERYIELNGSLTTVVQTVKKAKKEGLDALYDEMSGQEEEHATAVEGAWRKEFDRYMGSGVETQSSGRGYVIFLFASCLVTNPLDGKQHENLAITCR